jgi:hypothetical protein
MKVKELIKQLLDEDLDADVVIFASGYAVDVDGISSNYQSSKVEGMSIGAVCIEPDSPVQRW